MREVFGPVAEDAGHRLDGRIAEQIMVRGDRELLTQLFSNLIENAIVHTPAGTRIVLGLAATKAQVIATVRDNGPGVPEQEHAKLFRRLYRREISRATPGYGLGLALVAAIAELHGGSVTIDSRESAGFSIAVALPAEAIV